MISEQEYHKLRVHLTIDVNNLDDSLIALPMAQMEIAEYTAEAAKIRDRAKNILEVVTADTASKIRTIPGATKAPSEAQIKSELPLYTEIQEAEESLLEAEYDYNLWKGLADALTQKSRSISIISDLIKSGYMTPNTIRTDRREIINTERMRRNPNQAYNQV